MNVMRAIVTMMFPPPSSSSRRSLLVHWMLVHGIIVISIASPCHGRVMTRRSRDVTSFCPDDAPYMKSGRCTEECGPGFYGNDDKRSCEPCSPGCKTCDKEPNRCTSCPDPLYLQEDRCQSDCGTLLSRGPPRGRVRLTGGRNSFEGVVEILHEDVFGTICDDQWNINAANVICHELQLGDAVEAVNAADAGFTSVSGRTPILLEGVTCRGNEGSIQECTHGNWYTTTCGHFEDAGVRCSGPDVSRLCVSDCGGGFYHVPDTSRCELCDVTCRTCVQRADYCLTCDAPRFLRDDRCVRECGLGFYGNTRTRTCEPCSPYCSTCRDGESDSVCTGCAEGTFLHGGVCVTSCDSQHLQRPLSIRLANGDTPFEGRVEVFVNGDWGTVCDDEFDIHDAAVICRQLGFGPPVTAVRSPGFGPGQGKILIDDLRCNGTEEELVNCVQSDFGNNDCNHHEDAGVQCSGTATLAKLNRYLPWQLITNRATGACVEDCGIGYYQDGPQCVACAASCLSCERSPNHCTACKSPTFLKNGVCVNECGDNMFGNTVTSQCEECDLDACGSCADGITNHICTTCPDSRFMKNSACVISCGPDMFLLQKICVTDCGVGMYGDPQTATCRSCDSECQSCDLDDTLTVKCSSCHPPKVLDVQSGACVDQCSSSLFASLAEDLVLPGQVVRLAGGMNQLQGRIEVFHEGEWGTICNDLFDIHVAHVACRALGLGNAVQVLEVGAPSGIAAGNGTIWLDDLLCQGDETSLEDCQYSDWGKHNCDHTRDAAIQCSGPGLRKCVPECLTGFYANWEDQTCHLCQSNCESCHASPNYTCTRCRPGTHLMGSQCLEDCGPGYYSSAGKCIQCSQNCATCQLDSTHCTSCQPDKFLQENICVDNCREYKLERTNVIRLVDGSSSLEGRVEVKIGEAYGSVCDDYWDLQDADVVCRQLGLGRALEASIEAKFGSSRGAIVLDNVDCRGTESNLLECEHNGQGIHDCSHREDAGVVCEGPDTSNSCTSASACSNGKYVTSDGQSCGICDLNCATCSKEATHCLTCPNNHVRRTDFTCSQECEEGSYADEQRICQPCSDQCTACSGTSSQCTRCPEEFYLDTETQTCVASCTGLVSRGRPDIRLVGGKTRFEGRVEVLYGGTWGTICDDEFDLADANVVCRQLNMGSALSVHPEGIFGPGLGPILLDELMCSGEESTLTLCNRAHSEIGRHDCSHQEDVGVTCSGPDTSLRCVSSCDDGYFANEQSECVMCSTSCLTCETTPDTCTGCRAPSFLHGSNCTTACPIGKYGNTKMSRCEPCDLACKECYDGQNGNMCRTCKPGYFLQGFSCQAGCSDGYQPLSDVLLMLGESEPVRLTGGSNQAEGRVEIFHGGSWGTVCNNNWDLTDADVVCHQLGQGKALEILWGGVFGMASSDTPVWMNGVDCKGWELGLSQCVNAGWGNTGCSHNSDVAIRCSGTHDQERGNMCRQVIPSPCDTLPCSTEVECVSVNGNQSVCLECPKGEVGNGVNCTVVSSDAPTFSDVPVNRTVTVGSGATFRCKADGEPTPRVTVKNWLKDGQPLPAQDLASGRIRVFISSGTLQFTRTRREDTGNYTCQIGNTHGVASESAFLTVKETPHILRTKSDVVVVGETAMLSCFVVGLPESSITWSRDGARDRETLSGDHFQSFNTNGTLLIHGITHGDGGTYWCSATNPLGIDQSAVTLTVYESPTFLEEPRQIEVREGTDISIPCTVSGVPQPIVTWKKNGAPLNLQDERLSIKDGTLRIQNVQRNDMAKYACIATNIVQTSSRFDTILIIGPPHIVTRPTNQTLVTGETLHLPCEVIGTGNPVVVWQHNGKVVETGGSHYQVSNDSLVVNDVDPRDNGLYTCSATNTEGSVTTNAYVSITGPIRLGQHKHVGTNVTMIIIFFIIFIVLVIGVILFLRRRHLSRKEMMAKSIFKGPLNDNSSGNFWNTAFYRQFDNSDETSTERQEKEEEKRSGGRLPFYKRRNKDDFLLENIEDI